MPVKGPRCSVVYAYGKQCGNSTHANNGLPWLICPEHMKSFALFEAERRSAEIARHRAAMPPPRPVQQFVYYVSMPGDLIKIGFTADLAARLRGLTVQPDDLLAVEPGGREVEARRHRQFAHLRWRRSERFRDDPVLRQHIASLLEEHGKPVLVKYRADPALHKAQPVYVA